MSETETVTPPPASPAPGETPSPLSPALYTPPQAQAGPSGAIWTDDEDVAWDVDMEVPLKRESSAEVESGSPRKRARVAFAHD